MAFSSHFPFSGLFMSPLKKLFSGLTLMLIACFSLAASIDISGVKVEDTANVGNSSLKLNGAGIRYKAIFKVYVSSLYASKKVSSLDELVAAPGPKRMTMTMLREIDSNSLGKLLTRGVEDNNPKTEMSKLVPGLIRLGDTFNAYKALNPGDVILIDFIPGTGTIITVKGKVQGEPFKEPEFFKAIMSIWLGPVPADFKLKDALLGNR